MKHPLLAILVCGILLLAAGAALAGDHTLAYTDDGDASGDRLGHGVSGAGDVNADGFDDFIAGAYYGNGSRKGYARVYSGKDGQLLYTLRGAYNYDGFGVSVNAAGDVDADGYDDVIVGAHLDDGGGTDAGCAIVYSGKTGKDIYTWEGDGANDRFGLTSNGAGDVNQDGYDDLVVGAYYTSGGTAPGYVKVFSGKDGKLLYKFTGKSTKDYFGVYVNRAGDVNADGYPDVIVGASLDDTGGTDSGRLVVYSGKDGKVLHDIAGPRSGANFGRCVDTVGDIDGDGYDDFVSGAYLDDSAGTDRGSVTVYSGKTGGVLYRWYGDKTGDRIGVHVDGGGDVNNDGYPDVVAGAYYADGSYTDCGAMRVYSGRDGSTLYTFYGPAASVYYGRFASFIGDANGDGLDDLIAGAYGTDYGGTDTGRIYVYISPAPGGTIAINDGDETTNSTSATLSITWQAAPTGGEVEDMRLRNGDDPWGAWVPVAATKSWTLSPGDGEKTVGIMFRDEDGATSAEITDTIVLDQTPPIGTITINVGLPSTSARMVGLQLTYSDLQTGVEWMRFRNEGEAWSAWDFAAETASWTLTGEGGTKQVDAQFRDGAGNLSDIVSDTIEYLADVVPPWVTSVRVNQGAPYVLPGVPIEFEVYASDNLGGAGPDSFKVTYDGGKTWSPWYTLDFGPVVDVEHPGLSGLVTARVVVRDKALNESEEYEVAFYLLEPDLPDLGSGAKFAGGTARAEDVDGMVLRLVAGDVLSVKIKAKAAEKGKSLDLLLDLLGADGDPVVEGVFPAGSAKPGIAGFVVPASGVYTLVVHRSIQSPAESGTYKLAAKVKQAKTNKKGKGEFTGTEIPFEAAGGSTLKASLKGAGLDPADVTLVGPEGEVAVAAGGKTGKVKVGPVVLDRGTGTYTLRFATAVTVNAKWSVKLGKIKGTVTE